jgi:hypothetical protein
MLSLPRVVAFVAGIALLCTLSRAAETVQILVPTAVNPDPQLNWIGPAIQMSLAADLGRRMTIVDGPATRIVTGSYQVVDGQIRFTGEVMDSVNSKRLATLKVTGNLDDLFEVEDQISAQASRALAQPESGPVAPVLVSSGPLHLTVSARPEDASLAYARPFVNNHLQAEQEQYNYYTSCYNTWGCGCWGWGWCCGPYGLGWCYGAYPTATFTEPGW